MHFQTNKARAGWVKYVLLVVLIVGGSAAGFYLSGGWPSAAPTPADVPELEGPSVPLLQRFPLSALDAKDQIEAPSLAADRTGRVFLAWASKTGEAERTVFLTRSTDGGRSFASPLAVSKAGVYKSVARMGGKSVGHERRATPHVAADGDKVYLSWSEALPDESGLRMVLATSADSGATFGKPGPVHRGEHPRATFTGMTIAPDGAVACTWLDDRAGFQQPFAAIRRAGQPEFEEEQLVHAGQSEQGVCPCCPTAAAFNLDGTLYVAFRNIDNGYRDIAVCRHKPGQSAFEAPVAVAPPAWKFEGCPHDGPSLAVAGGALHVCWMDARSGPQRCYYARSGLDDLKFEARELHPIPSGTQGNARLVADAAGGLHAVWEESLGAAADDAPADHTHGPPRVGIGSGRAIMYAYLAPGKADFGPALAVAPKPGTFQTRPALLGTSDGNLFVAWNALDEAGKAVVITRLTRPSRKSVGGAS